MTDAEQAKRKEQYRKQAIKRANDPKRIAYLKEYRKANKARIQAYADSYKDRKAVKIREYHQKKKAEKMAYYLANKEAIDKVRADRMAAGSKKAGEISKLRAAAHYEANKEPIDSARAAAKVRANERRRNNEDRKAKERVRNRNRNRSEHRKSYLKHYTEQNRDAKRKYRMAYERQRQKADPEYRLIYLLRKRTLGALKRAKIRKSFQSPLVFLGCTIEELRAHIEKQFEPWMTWENHGPYGWHVDHIKPLAAFNLSDPGEYAKASHYTNLRPMHWRDNLRKGAKVAA